MDPLAEHAASRLTQHPAPALPLEELTEQVRGGGTAVGPAALLRALEARPDLFRVLDPWRGPWRAAAAVPGARRAGTGRDRPHAAAGTRWVVALGRGGATDKGPQARLKASLVRLGLTLDERSVTELARWLGMVRQASGGQSPEALRGTAGNARVIRNSGTG